MKFDDSKRWVLVTGASGGIGEAICRTLAPAGFNVLAGVRPGGTNVSPAIASSADLIDLDLTSSEQLETIRERVADHTGGFLYGLVNNAGIAIPGAFELSNRDEWVQQIAVNVTGTIGLTRELLPLIRTSHGRLVVVTSVVGRLPMPFNAVHCGTKHFLEGFFDSLRVEVERAGVNVAIVQPGAIHTGMIDKFSTSADIAQQRIPDDLKKLYGPPLHSMRTEMRAHIDDGSPPEVVSDAVLAALRSRRPRTRYPVGHQARKLLLLAQFLPDRSKDALLRRFLNLNPG
nr:SDR family NAD(P)-dependent oxidoreductase [Mycolicibacterium malmesburyense]CRL67252.1 dehydrogenase/decarboxylase protein [Mycolicibacterium malmesburyense]